MRKVGGSEKGGTSLRRNTLFLRPENERNGRESSDSGRKERFVGKKTGLLSGKSVCFFVEPRALSVSIRCAGHGGIKKLPERELFYACETLFLCSGESLIARIDFVTGESEDLP